MIGHLELKRVLIDELLQNSDLAFEEIVERQSQALEKEKAEKKVASSFDRLSAFNDNTVNSRFSKVIQMMNA